jgi:hypothetical protein
MLADYANTRLQVPAHQREPNAWNFVKQREYIKRLHDSARGCHPPGSFATYQLVGRGEPSPVFLNDGYQRLTALKALQVDPTQFEMEEDGVFALLQQRTTVQHRHYVSHDDAMRDFQLINNGTRLTPHELCRGHLKYMPDYDEQWSRLIETVEESVRDSEVRLRARKAHKKQERLNEHKRRRHTLALFHRYLSGEKRHCHYPDVPASEIQRYVDSGEIVELRLRYLLLDVGFKEASRVQRKFRQFLENETALLEECIREVLGSGVGLAPVAHRWLLDLAVWRFHNQVPRDRHAAFIRKFLKYTKGLGVWIQDRGERQERITLSLSHLGVLPKLAECAGMPEFCESPRRKRDLRLRPGFDNSHEQSFALFGEGPTFPEPAPLNRSRGARSVGDAD